MTRQDINQQLLELFLPEGRYPKPFFSNGLQARTEWTGSLHQEVDYIS